MHLLPLFFPAANSRSQLLSCIHTFPRLSYHLLLLAIIVFAFEHRRLRVMETEIVVIYLGLRSGPFAFAGSFAHGSFSP